MMHFFGNIFDTNTVSILDCFKINQCMFLFLSPGPWENNQVLLIVAATVQLRMYSSQLFSRYADVFVEEPEEFEVEGHGGMTQPITAAL